MNEAENMPVVEPEVEVDLASPWKRIGAALLNSVLSLAAYIPWIIAVFEGSYVERIRGEPADGDDFDMMWLAVGCVVMLIYGAVQIFFMSRDGQSLGKKILGIRVIKTDGRNPGFFGTVFMREILYYLATGFVIGIIAYLAESVSGSQELFELLMNWLQLLLYVVCLIMMFVTKNDRRTLQDYFANTVVVQLPKS